MNVGVGRVELVVTGGVCRSHGRTLVCGLLRLLLPTSLSMPITQLAYFCLQFYFVALLGRESDIGV